MDTQSKPDRTLYIKESMLNKLREYIGNTLTFNAAVPILKFLDENMKDGSENSRPHTTPDAPAPQVIKGAQ